MNFPMPSGLQLSRIVAFVMVLTIASASALASGPSLVDRVIVKKSDRKLLLIKGEEVLRSFDIALGLMPVGHKEREGDFRTPEGDYRLLKRNRDSRFFMSIEISYPNARDRSNAANKGVSPGGLIMIHGLPNEPSYPSNYYGTNDWTDGCIAVSNSAMVDIWLMTAEDTPIQILP